MSKRVFGVPASTRQVGLVLNFHFGAHLPTERADWADQVYFRISTEESQIYLILNICSAWR